MEKISPMMQHYLDTKAQYKDCILFYRLGDFYEMFFEDAKTASRELELTLTGKDCGMEERAPMCGIPFHAAEVYLDRLVKKGYKVAIAEQMEDPKLAKGLVKREVIRVVTPGTIISSQALDEAKNNYIMCIVYMDDQYGFAFSDISTGDFYLSETSKESSLTDEIFRLQPSEIICNEAFFMSGIDLDALKGRMTVAISSLENHSFDDNFCERILKEHFHASSLLGLGIADYPCGVIAAGALLSYLKETQKNDLNQLTGIHPYMSDHFMLIDTSTRRNLELIETLREKQKRGSLLGVLDRTKTAMGARMMRKFILEPLIDRDEIMERQNAVEDLSSMNVELAEMREYLSPVYDLERLIGRISYQSANARDLLAFKNSLEMIPHIKNVLKQYTVPELKKCYDELDTLEDVCELICNSIAEEPPISLREGGLIKEGYDAEVDRLRLSKTEGKNWLADMEAKERERSGIKSLRIRYNKVFGYYLEVTNSFKDMVPEDYVRKQTLTNAERYTTPKLKELEDVILGAEDKLTNLEYNIFCEVRNKIADEILRVQKTAQIIAKIDVYASLAYVAIHNNYVKPSINEKGVIHITDGRHPVVEQMMSSGLFVTNDVLLDNHNNRIAIITGPNMAGKSTYMRQVALITLMAQIGSFVPAGKADIGICDRIFTRVGASDDLASGQSTFMVEMNEVSNILRNATKNSLVVLDEIGRGTSTYDGMSIAWAVVEYIADTKLLGAKTLFATHYHELTELEGAVNGVNNYCIAVKEQGDNITFLRKIMKGGADRSYGIQVAKLAGVPDKVIERAKELVEQLTDADIAVRAKEIADNSKFKPAKKIKRPDEVDANQLTLFDTVKESDIINEIENLELGKMTPIDALNTLYQYQTKLKNRL